MSTAMSTRRSPPRSSSATKEGLVLDNRLVAIEQALIAGADARAQRRAGHRPVRGGHCRGDPQRGGRSRRRLAERRGPDARPLDLPPRYQRRAIPTGCWSKPTRKSERRFSRARACFAGAAARRLRHAPAGAARAAAAGSGARADATAAASCHRLPPPRVKPAWRWLLRPRSTDRGAAARSPRSAELPGAGPAQDRVGLTTAADWQPLCAEAPTLAAGAAAAFFRDRFDWVRVGDGRGFRHRLLRARDRRVAHSGSRATRCRSTPSPTISSAATRPDGDTGRGRVDHERPLRPLLHPRRDRGRGAGRARAGARPGRPTRSSCSSSRSRARAGCKLPDGR